MEELLIDDAKETIKKRDEAHEKMEMFIEGSPQYRYWKERWEARCADLKVIKKAFKEIGREDLWSMVEGF